MTNPRLFQLRPKKAVTTLTSAKPTVNAAPAATATRAHDDPIDAAMRAAAASVSKLLTPEQVADALGVTQRTLERWRIVGGGPAYVKLTRSTVRYVADEIAAFIESRIRSNTAQQ